MTNVIANLFIDVHPWKAKLTLSLDGNCIIISPTASGYCLQQMLPSALADGSTSSLCIALSDCRSCWFDIEFHAIQAATKPNTRAQLQVSEGKLGVKNSVAARLEHFGCQLY